MDALRPHHLRGLKPPTYLQARRWIGWRVVDMHGGSVGRIEDVIEDETGGMAAWIAINEFRFGRNRRFIAPAAEAVETPGQVWLPFSREQIRASTSIYDGRYNSRLEDRLRRFYLLEDSEAA